jgi:hypothetical protein
MVMTAVAGIRLFIEPACNNTFLRGNESKRMAVFMAYRFRHMAGDTTAESMDSMRRPSLQCFMTIHAEAVRRQLCHGYSYIFFLMDIMAVRAHNPIFCMFACLPLIVLLVMLLPVIKFLNVGQI